MATSEISKLKNHLEINKISRMCFMIGKPWFDNYMAQVKDPNTTSIDMPPIDNSSLLYPSKSDL